MKGTAIVLAAVAAFAAPTETGLYRGWDSTLEILSERDPYALFGRATICRFPIILGISVPVYATVRTMVDRDIAMAYNQSPSRLDQLTFRNLDTPMREDSSDSKLFPSFRETEHRRNRAPASQDGDH